MKIFKFVIMAFVMSAVFLLSGCAYNIKNEMIDSLSDVRYNLFEAKTQDMKVTLMCGMREEPYEYDGKSNKKCEFGVITVNFFDLQEAPEIDFFMQVGETEYNGKLEKNPYQLNYMVDIETLIDDNASIYLTVDGYVGEMILVCVSKDWNIQYQNVLDIATEHLEVEARQFFKNRVFNAECYLKIIYDENSDLETYLWYFGIVGTDNSRISLVIDVNSGQILASNVE